MLSSESSPLFSQMRVYLRKAEYFLFLLLLIVLSTLPSWNWIEMRPQLFLIALYHWTLYQPSLLNLGQIFFLGLIQDSIYGYPLGLSSVEFLLLHGALLTQQRYLLEATLMISWLGFAVFSLIDSLFHWGLFSYGIGAWLEYSGTLPGLFLTICLYPFGVKTLALLKNKLG